MPEVRIIEDEAIGVEPRQRVRHEERRREEALIEDQRQRRENRQRSEQDDHAARQSLSHARQDRALRDGLRSGGTVLRQGTHGASRREAGANGGGASGSVR